ncbi:sterol desaturase family protein [Ekhidna sp.]|jgi:4-hydroxysphinganine ceramide fatty acyl 2-hydroxylase|uniref:sterol desaturase family protein n=1 Tax=Ekhidna sp. TaxID=2608089 RepID=UPI0032F085A2
MKKESQLFQNPILERLTRTHIAVPISLLLLYAMGLMYWSVYSVGHSLVIGLPLFFCGFLVFTLIEYLMHRFVFHMEPNTSFKKTIQYKFHGVHHDFPKEKDRLAMPPLVSITLATLLLAIFKLVIGDYVFSFLPGVLLGYALYLFVHYILHAYNPPKNIFRSLWINHSVHHYKSPDKRYGVSSPLWDHIFGTF